MSVAAVVLAAGESRRMGRAKLLLPWGSGTVLGSVVASLLDAGAEPVVVVLGAGADAVQAALRPWVGDGRVQSVRNANFAQGMLSSVQTGLAAVPAACTALLLMLGDHPAVPAAVSSALLAAHAAQPDAIVVPVHGGRRGHPVLFPASLWPEIAALGQGDDLRSIQRRHPQRLVHLAVDTPAILIDLDTPDDYARHLPLDPTAPGKER